ncbi:unnamed protein product [Acanthoscelides obtectus]|uniref:Uncharacterized protein n=1 Tax=Acanthoscelides obtectus TaxID=200917 RepID=A0A9P0KNF3_ACAOB|nr:unnamed protein product [Acanthoscelides obtectus]CAK1655829.1 hypothetical protein AOBTE_LOCUS19372 [Acanthoscelides obtectus]
MKGQILSVYIGLRLGDGANGLVSVVEQNSMIIGLTEAIIRLSLLTARATTLELSLYWWTSSIWSMSQSLLY